MGSRFIIDKEITVENPSKEFIKFCESEFVVANPDFEKKERMGLWIGSTSKWLYLYRICDGNIILPFGTGKTIKRFIDGNTEVIQGFKDLHSVNYNASIPLYDYQKKAVEEIVKAKNGILQSAAGSGKTQMGLALICRLGYKALWLTHTKDLLTQSYNRAKMYMSEDLLGTITAGKINIGKGITFATVQTLCKQDLSLYENEFDVVVVDECHRVSGTPASVSQFSKVLNSLCARHKFGVSATVHRSDNMIKCCYALLGNVVYTVPDSAVEEKIMRVKVLKRELNTSESEKYLDGAGMLEYGNLINYLCKNNARNYEMVADLRENRGHSCLILSDRISHLEQLKDLLASSFSALISGKSKKEYREKVIDDMRNGKLKYLFASYSLAKEGLDIPCLDRLFLVTPHSDYAVIVQSVGRIARKCDGKKDAVCYDYVDKNIGYAERCFKKRCTHYRKARCQL